MDNNFFRIEAIAEEAAKIRLAIEEMDPCNPSYIELAKLLLEMTFYLVANDNATQKPYYPEEPVAINEAIKQHEEEQKPEPPKKEGASYTLEEVRELFREAATSGIRIQPIVKQFVEEGEPSKLSSVKPERYPELVAALEEAKNNAQ